MDGIFGREGLAGTMPGGSGRSIQQIGK